MNQYQLGEEIIMDRKITLGLALLVGGVAVTGQAHAQNTYLINFPIADILKHREGLFTFRTAGFARNINKGFDYKATAAFGVLDKAELGVSNDLRGHTTFDGKVQLWEDAKQGVAVSLGETDYDFDTRKGGSYLAFRKDFPAFRFHALAFKSDTTVGVFGVDFPLAHGWGGAIEHVTGPNSEIWVGANSPVFMKHFNVLLTSRFPWDGGLGHQYQAVVNYGFRF
jgi:hypothetical protein